jgi:tetrapyrrole methylase family protein/MazG family protein
MPALLRAYKVQKRLSNVGLDFENIKDIFDKIYEELEELKKSETKEQKTEELGDVLFSLVNLSRFFDIDPQEALHLSIDKIVNRFEYIEKRLNSDFKGTSLALLNELWEESKANT